MKLSKKNLKNLVNGLKISGLLGLSTLVVIGGIINKDLYADTISSTTNNTSKSVSTLYPVAPTDYVKPLYTYKVTEYSTPTTVNELSASDVAEVMSQEIYRFFKVDITGKKIELTHYIDRTTSKPCWHGTLPMDSLNTIRIRIDSVTGELSFIEREIKTPIDPNTPDTIEELRQMVTKNLDTNCKKVEDLITSSDYLPEKIKSVTYDTSRGMTRYSGETGKEKEIGEVISHIFNVTTVSNKTYQFTLSKDLTRIDGIETPEYLTKSKAYINLVKLQYNE